MTEKQKMLSGELYDGFDPELLNERGRARRLLALYNATAMEDKEVQKQMLASGAIIVPPERRSTEYLKEYMVKEIEKNGAPIKAAGLSIE